MSEPIFRYAAADDCDRLHALIERAYRGEESAGRWDSESHLLQGPRTSAEFIAARIAGTDSRFVVAETSDTPIGCALIQRSAEFDTAPDTAFFGMFAIDNAARSIGLGGAILAECERRSQDLWGSTAMVMTVISLRTELIDWYARRGYRPTGAENKYNAWYVKSEVKGAASGKLAGRTVVLKDNVALAGVPMMNGASTL